MDENKEKLTGGNQNANVQNDYREEMEELARIFKEELDKTTAEAEEKAKVEEEKLSPKEELCECCGERPRGTEKDPKSPFCSECEEILEEYPYDWKGAFMAIVAVCVAVASVFLFVINAPVFSAMKQGDKALKNNNVYSAVTSYDTALGYIDEDSYGEYLGFQSRVIETQYKLLNMDTALQVIVTYYSDFQLKLPMFDKVEKMCDEIEAMQASVVAIQNHLDKFTTIEDDQYDAIIAELQSLSGKKIYVKDGECHDETETDYVPDGTEDVYICDEGWLNLYMYSAAQYCNKGDEVCAEYLEKTVNESNYIDRLVNSLLGATYVGIGEYEKAEKIAESIKEQNNESPDYYMVKSMLLRYRDKDYQKGADICDEGIEILENIKGGEQVIADTGYVLAMHKALNYIMLGDYNEAYLAITDCYNYQMNGYGPGLETRDLYAMLALATGDTKSFENFELEIKEYGDDSIQFSSDVTDYKNGKITLEELAMSGRYDLV